jgi:Uncharacterised protein family (UPF0203)
MGSSQSTSVSSSTYSKETQSSQRDVNAISDSEWLAKVTSKNEEGSRTHEDNAMPIETEISYHTTEKSSPPQDLSGMQLVHHVCRKRKKIYDKCVSTWFEKEFLNGKSTHQEEVCGNKFELYRKCLLKGIRKEVWEKQYKLPPPGEDSPLADVMDDDECKNDYNNNKLNDDAGKQ